MDKWEELKKWIQENRDEALVNYMRSTKHHTQKGDEAWNQIRVTCNDVLEMMGTLEREECHEPKEEGKHLSKEFLGFLYQGIKAKNWESAMKRRTNGCTDEAEFLEGYTTALIDIKNYYEKILKLGDK